MLNLIVGGDGFIGRNLATKLIEDNERVLVLDVDIWNSTTKFPLALNPNYEIYKPSSLDWSEQCISRLGKNTEIVIWHLAANSDIAKASKDLNIDYQLTLGSTIEMLKVAQRTECRSIEFTSSSAVYGKRIANARFLESDKLLPISNYGTMKMASESIIRNVSTQYRIPYHIYRLANIVGPQMTHGLIFDISKKISVDNKKLQVLGDGNQRKSYMHVEDLLNTMIMISNKSESFTINTGPNDNGMIVKEIVDIIIKEINIFPEIYYESKSEGWVGDVVDSIMDTSLFEKHIDFQISDSRRSIEKAVSSRIAEIS